MLQELRTHRSNDFYEIVDMLDKRLNDKGKNWRHVLKSLKVVDYCLHEGSELVVTWARKNIYIIKTLREFTYIEDDDKDVGQNGMWNASSAARLLLICTSPCIGKGIDIFDFGRRATSNRKS